MLVCFVHLVRLDLGLFLVPCTLLNICSESVKYDIDIIVQIALNLQIALGSTDILKMLIIPIHKHSIYSFICVFLNWGPLPIKEDTIVVLETVALHEQALKEASKSLLESQERKWQAQQRVPMGNIQA